MRKNGFFRIFLLIVGFVACLAILLAGAYRVEIVHNPQTPTVASAEKITKGAETTEQSESGDQKFLSAPQEAVTGSSTTIMDCPPYKIIVHETSEDEKDLSFDFTEIVNNFFKILVRSLIRSNAP